MNCTFGWRAWRRLWHHFTSTVWIHPLVDIVAEPWKSKYLQMHEPEWNPGCGCPFRGTVYNFLLFQSIRFWTHTKHLFHLYKDPHLYLPFLVPLCSAKSYAGLILCFSKDLSKPKLFNVQGTICQIFYLSFWISRENWGESWLQKTSDNNSCSGKLHKTKSKAVRAFFILRRFQINKQLPWLTRDRFLWWLAHKTSLRTINARSWTIFF